MNHTPTPWHTQGTYILDAHHVGIGHLDFDADRPDTEALVNVQRATDNAAFIVRACNAHDELVAENVRLKAQLAASCDDARSDPESIACPIGYLVGDLAKHLQHLAYACEQTAPHIHTSEARAALAKVTA